jgi:Bax protein
MTVILSIQPSFSLVFKRVFGVIILSVFFAGIASAQHSFVRKYRPLADSLAAEYEIPAALILGVAIIESGNGTSRNCKLLNNYFGIVGKNKLLKEKGITSRYKAYPDAAASFSDFCRVVSKKKYYKKLKGNMDYRLWTEAMSQHGYSEVPDVWKKRINDAIRKNKLSSAPVTLPKKEDDKKDKDKEKDKKQD